MTKISQTIDSIQHYCVSILKAALIKPVLLIPALAFLTACASTTLNFDTDTQQQLNKGSSGTHNCGASTHYKYNTNPIENIGTIHEIAAPDIGPYPYFEFLEGPVWLHDFDGGSLFFSDLVAPARVWKLTPPSVTPVLFRQNSGSNGIALDNQNQLILADREARRISKLNPKTGAITDVIPANGEFKPNDLIVRSDNNLYFSAPKDKVYRVSPDGTLNTPITSIHNPNGIALSLDESTLYVGDFSSQTITAFKLKVDGSIHQESARVFAKTVGNKADGMTLDCAGNLYIGTDLGVEVFNTAGKALGHIKTGRASNVAFGGADRQTLYITTRSLIKYVKLNIAGLPN